MLFKKSFFYMLLTAQVVMYGAEQSAIQSLKKQKDPLVCYVFIHWDDQVYRSYRRKSLKASRQEMQADIDVYICAFDPGRPLEEVKTCDNGFLSGYFCEEKGYLLVFSKMRVGSEEIFVNFLKENLCSMILSQVGEKYKKILIKGSEVLFNGMKINLEETVDSITTGREIIFEPYPYVDESLRICKPNHTAAPISYGPPIDPRERFEKRLRKDIPGATPMPTMANFTIASPISILPKLTEEK